MGLVFFFLFFHFASPLHGEGGGVGKRGRRGRLSPVCWLVRQWGVRVSVGSTAPWLREVESRVARRRAQSTRVPPHPRLCRGAGQLSCPVAASGVRAPAGRELNTFGDLEVRWLCGVGGGGARRGLGSPGFSLRFGLDRGPRWIVSPLYLLVPLGTISDSDADDGFTDTLSSCCACVCVRVCAEGESLFCSSPTP